MYEVGKDIFKHNFQALLLHVHLYGGSSNGKRGRTTPATDYFIQRKQKQGIS